MDMSKQRSEWCKKIVTLSSFMFMNEQLTISGKQAGKFPQKIFFFQKSKCLKDFV